MFSRDGGRGSQPRDQGRQQLVANVLSEAQVSNAANAQGGYGRAKASEGGYHSRRGTRGRSLPVSLGEKSARRLDGRGIRKRISVSPKAVFHRFRRSIRRDPWRACPQGVSPVSDLCLRPLQRHGRRRDNAPGGGAG